MGNIERRDQERIRPTPPQVKLEKEVKGTASSAETKATEMLASVKAYEKQLAELQKVLNQYFGEEIGTDALKILSGKLDEGKVLSFDLVKECILEAAKKRGETVNSRKLELLEKLPIFDLKPVPERMERPKKEELDPFVEIIKTLQAKAKSDAELKQKVQERAMEEALKQLLEKQRDLKKEVEESQKPHGKKLRDPRAKI